MANMEVPSLFATCSNDIRLWRVGDDSSTAPLLIFKRPQRASDKYQISELCWNHDNKLIAGGDSDGAVVIYKTDGTYLQSLQEKIRYEIYCMRFSSGSRYIATGAHDGCLRVWDLRKSALSRSFKVHTGACTVVRYSPTDNHIASGGMDGFAYIHSLSTGKTVGTFRFTRDSVDAIRALEYSTLKKTLMAGAAESGRVTIWDVSRQTTVAQFTSHTAPASGLAFSKVNDSLLVSTGLDMKMYFYDVNTKKQVKVIEGGSPFSAVDFGHDGFSVVAGDVRGNLYEYDLRNTSEPLSSVKSAHDRAINCVRFPMNANPAPVLPTAVITAAEQAAAASGMRKQPAPGTEKAVEEESEHVPSSSSTDAAAGGMDVFSPLKTTGALDTDVSSGFLSPLAPPVAARIDYSSLIASASSLPPISAPTSGLLSPLQPQTLSQLQRTSNAGVNSSVLSPLNISMAPASSRFNLDSVSPSSLYEDSVTPRGDSSDSNGVSGVDSTLFSPLGAVSSVNRTIAAHDSTVLSPLREEALSASSIQAPTILQSPGLKAPDTSIAGRTVAPSPMIFTPTPRANKTRTRASFFVPSAADSLPSQPLFEAPAPVSRPVRPVSPRRAPEPSAQYPSKESSSEESSSSEPASGGSASMQWQLVRGALDEMFQSFRSEINGQIQNLHLEMLRQFQVQQMELANLFASMSVRQEMIDELRRLREENERLRNMY